MRFLRTHTTGIFIGYRLIVGAALLILLFSGRLSPLNEPRPAEPHARNVAQSVNRSTQ